MRPQINDGVITIILLVSILEGQSTAIFEVENNLIVYWYWIPDFCLKTESVRGQIRDSRWNWNSHIDYSNEEFAGDSAKKILINEVTDFKRDKRQIQNNISGEKGEGMTSEEQLLVEDPKGWDWPLA